MGFAEITGLIVVGAVVAAIAAPGLAGAIGLARYPVSAPSVIGTDSLLGSIVRVESGLEVSRSQAEEGWVLLSGERWRARAEQPLHPGDLAEVVAINGLVLEVVPAPVQDTYRRVRPMSWVRQHPGRATAVGLVAVVATIAALIVWSPGQALLMFIVALVAAFLSLAAQA